MKKITFVILMLVSALMLSSCSLGIRKMLGMAPTAEPAKTSSSKPAADAVNITKTNLAPHTIDVTVGTTVTWTNKDTVPHTLVSDTGSTINSGPINPGATFTFTFTQAGTFPYHASDNKELTGTVIVK